jgi:hypothetical protein
MAAADGLVLASYPRDQTSSSFTTFATDELADYFAYLFRATSAESIAKAFFNFSAVSGTPTAEISLQGVTAGGIPDGSIKSSGNAKDAWTATAGAGWRTLGSSYTPTRGERLAVVLKITAGTSVTNNVRVGGSPLHWPRGQTFNNTGAVTTQLGTPAVGGVKGTGTSWVFGNPISVTSANAITTASIIEEGMVFTVPSDLTSIRVVGVEAAYRMSSSTTSEIRIYSGSGASDTTVAQTISLDSAIDVQATGSTSTMRVFFPDAVTVNGGSGFRISSRTTAGTVTNLENLVIDPEDLLAFGTAWVTGYRTRRTTGNWTDDTRRTVFYSPIIDQVTVPSGGGGGGVIIHPGMAGGMRG